MASSITYALYNTSWSLHRLSPLYTPASTTTGAANDRTSPFLSQTVLTQHARRFADILKGEAFPGVDTSLVDGGLDDGLLRAGPLKSCQWSVLPSEREWESGNIAGEAVEANAGTTTRGLNYAGVRGVLVTLSYERAVYKAILLRSSTTPAYRDDAEESDFTHLPLLLTRMPVALKSIFTDHISTTFDARVSPLRLSTPFLEEAMETYMHDLMSNYRGDSIRSDLREIIKALNMTLAFAEPVAPSLKTLDLVQPIETYLDHVELPGVQSSASHLDDKAKLIPFVKAQLKEQLAMDVSAVNEDGKAVVRLAKLGCATFVLGADGKVKIIAPPVTVVDDGAGDGAENPRRPRITAKRDAQRLANDGLVEMLLGRAMGAEFGTGIGIGEAG